GKNNEPPIKGFVLSGPTNIDSTDIVLSQPHAILLFCEEFTGKTSKWKKEFSDIYAKAAGKQVPVYLITAQPDDARNFVAGTPFACIPVFKCDYKAILTSARTNPCLYYLRQGTVVGTWSYHGMHRVNADLDKMNSPAAPVN